MKDKIRKAYYNLTLASKIRYSYILILIPMIIFVTISFYNLWNSNRKYEDMIKSAGVASEFSLDFKKDYDYETYLVIVENKTIEESDLDRLLDEANRVVNQLEQKTDSGENSKRLKSVKRYLKNLATYQERIKENLLEGNKYEDNIEIWENDVQIVTSLLRESIIQYIYYEIGDLQQSRIEYQNFYVVMLRISLIASALLIILISVLSYYIPRSITSPIKEISKVTDQVARGDLTVRSEVKSGAEVGTLSDSLNTMIDKISELLEQVTKEQTRLRKAELELLQSQINPHFLYNTLDTIVWLEEAGDHKQVVGMVKSLSEFFRASLSQGKEVVTVFDELKHVRSYLEIQQVRYHDILEFKIDVPKSVEACLIPKITIQPLVENALYHGIKNKRGIGKIVISCVREDQYFLLQVKDNGIGIQEKQLEIIKENILHRSKNENENYGLYNVNERIRLKFGEEYGIYIESVYMDGTTVSIKLPYREIE